MFNVCYNKLIFSSIVEKMTLREFEYKTSALIPCYNQSTKKSKLMNYGKFNDINTSTHSNK